MYKIYLAFREKRNQMMTKISAPKIPKKLQQEKIESKDWHMDVKILVSERFWKLVVRHQLYISKISVTDTPFQKQWQVFFFLMP